MEDGEARRSGTRLAEAGTQVPRAEPRNPDRRQDLMLTNLAGYESEPFATFDHTSSGSRQPQIQGLEAWWNRREKRLGQNPKPVTRGPATNSFVEISPANAVTRKALAWDGMTAEIVE